MFREKTGLSLVYLLADPTVLSCVSLFMYLFLLSFVQRDNATLMPSFHGLYNICSGILTWVGGTVGGPLGSAGALRNLAEQLPLCVCVCVSLIQQQSLEGIERQRNTLLSHGLALLLQCEAIIRPWQWG